MINYYNNVIETKIAANQNAVSSIIDLQTQFLNFLAKRSENVAKISSPPHLPPFPPPHLLPHLPPPSLSPSSIIQNTKLSSISKTPSKRQFHQHHQLHPQWKLLCKILVKLRKNWKIEI